LSVSLEVSTLVQDVEEEQKMKNEQLYEVVVL